MKETSSALIAGLAALVLIPVVLVLALSADSKPPASAGLCGGATAIGGELPDGGTYTQDQAGYAAIIVDTGIALNVPPRGQVIALATALVESTMENPDYGDRDSVGLFQQRPSQGWGTVEELTNPPVAAAKFYEALVKVRDWETRDPGEVAQAVQASAFPDRYGEKMAEASAIYESVLATKPIAAAGGSGQNVAAEASTADITPDGWPTGKISEYGGSDDAFARAESLPVSGGTPANPPLGPWYVAMRWPQPYAQVYPKIKDKRLLITGPRGSAIGYPADWGPAAKTGRIVDVAPELMAAIGAKTDDEVTVAWAPPDTPIGGAANCEAGAATGTIVDVPTPGGGSIQVDQALEGPLTQLLADAAAAGIDLGGGGYRDPQSQIETRKSNCGSSHYAIYEMAASSCSPPTAKPGTSMHETGLAVDFTYNGQTICFPRSTANCSGNAGHDWLIANAANYGLKNLSSEAWHFSTSGA